MGGVGEVWPNPVGWERRGGAAGVGSIVFVGEPSSYGGGKMTKIHKYWSACQLPSFFHFHLTQFSLIFHSLFWALFQWGCCCILGESVDQGEAL